MSFPRPDHNSGWIIYGTNWCKFCTMAKKELESKGYTFTFVNVDELGGIGRIARYLRNTTDYHKTIPFIFFNNIFIGGYSDLVKHRNSINTNNNINVNNTRNRCGGLSETKKSNDSIMNMCIQVQNDVEKHHGKQFMVFNPIIYKTQVVNGTNYFVKLEIDNGEYIHVRIHKGFDNISKYVNHLYPKGKNDEIEHF